MEKNSQIHIYLEPELLALLDIECADCGLNQAEYIRRLIRRDTRLTKVEVLLEKLDKKIWKR